MQSLPILSNPLLSFIILSLATWRISSLLVFEDGPADVFVKIRHFVGVRYDAHSKPYGTNIAAKAFVCIWCLSIWVGTAIVVFWLLFPIIIILVCLPLAFSAVSVMIEGFFVVRE